MEESMSASSVSSNDSILFLSLVTLRKFSHPLDSKSFIHQSNFDVKSVFNHIVIYSYKLNFFTSLFF